LRFGYDTIDDSAQDVIKIYTTNGETYDGTQKNEALNTRTVSLS
jgi:hypothetical protein